MDLFLDLLCCFVKSITCYTIYRESSPFRKLDMRYKGNFLKKKLLNARVGTLS